MIEGVTAVSVLWEEEPRVERLLTLLTAHFPFVTVVVQEGSDATYAIAERILRPLDMLLADKHRGAGDFSMPLALQHVGTPWSFVISGDELPSSELLSSLPQAVAAMEQQGNGGAFIEFQETIEGLPFLEHGRHVRLFRTEGGWEARLHSAAPHTNTILWGTGYIAHDRSLDEIAYDYLRYLTIAERDNDAGLLRVNRNMLFRACKLVAEAKGWRFVKRYEWWPEVEARVFAHIPSAMDIL